MKFLELKILKTIIFKNKIKSEKFWKKGLWKSKRYDSILCIKIVNKIFLTNITIPLTNEEIVERFNKIDKDGRRYTTVPVHAPGETKDGEQEGYGKECILLKVDTGDIPPQINLQN